MWNVKERTVRAGSILLSTTPVKLTDKEVDVRNSVVLLAASGNGVNNVLIGDADSQPFVLGAGATLTLRFVRPNDIWVVASAATPTVYYIASGVLLG